MSNGYKLDKGFLFDHRWAKQFRKLRPKDFHRIFWELYDYQVSEGRTSVPEHDENLTMSGIVSFVVPQINQRLWGQKNQYYQGLDASHPTLPPGVGTTSGTTPLKLSEDKISQDKLSEEEVRETEGQVVPSPAPSATASPTAPPPLSEQETEDLMKKGIPEDYLTKRALRAAAVGRSQGKRAYDVLMEWWQEDSRHRQGARDTPRIGGGVYRSESPSYDIDEFAEAAIQRGLRELDALTNAQKDGA